MLWTLLIFFLVSSLIAILLMQYACIQEVPKSLEDADTLASGLSWSLTPNSLEAVWSLKVI